MNKSTELTLNEIQVGLSASFSVVITKKMVEDFLQLSGDFNPLHSDETYAHSTKFGKIVVPGMLLASFFSRLVGMHIPGKNSLYMSQTLQFKQPTFVSDVVAIRGEVTAVSKKLGLITMATTVENNQSGTLLLTGEAKVLYLTQL